MLESTDITYYILQSFFVVFVLNVLTDDI